MTVLLKEYVVITAILLSFVSFLKYQCYLQIMLMQIQTAALSALLQTNINPNTAHTKQELSSRLARTLSQSVKLVLPGSHQVVMAVHFALHVHDTTQAGPSLETVMGYS